MNEKDGRVGQTSQFSRRFPRRQFHDPIGVLCLGQYSLEKTWEIGEGGLLFHSARAIPVGAEVLLNFFIPKGDFVTVRAQVLYGHSFERSIRAYGVKFINLPFEAKRMIRDYIAEKTHQEASESQSAS